MTSAGSSPVLVVYLAIDMSLVRRRNDACDLLLKSFRPGWKAGAKRSRLRRKAQYRSTINLHEVPIVADQMILEGQRLSERRVQQHQLRFNAPDTGGEHERLHDGTQQKHFVRGARMTRSNIEITNQAFVAFAHMVGVPHNVPARAQSTAAKGLDLDKATE